MAWTEHTSSSGRPFFYNPATGASVWERPAGISEARVFSRDTPPTLRACMATDRRVRALAGAIVRRCGVDALPRVQAAGADTSLCADGRGGAFCCESNRIFLCASTAWVSCRELAYELSHAYNTCTHVTRCAHGGIQVDDASCGYLSPPDLACSELRAAYWTERCAGRAERDEARCLKWHAAWALRACYPSDEHHPAHVRHAVQECTPRGADANLTRGGGDDEQEAVGRPGEATAADAKRV
ncbi:hypothetical protein EMIHUDRAFT_225815 [Emiliania huxleyi CCMP1516]|uniref:WW domain-containing protein n=2 Tax=Emiliania huxleyi TaxID=2903 RepID=A0A0D3I273_EMIH1|nr:hypothetical protein EMIHUDRAFT_199036 [Emiliania huxleyi CCMP1516]XP_005789558.1 hypothetical protein EMIHUDRAFT_225815 [Emiliania huxleyi CCMP1516]EOD05358.1 hypothetical protein EMIHUDRAFT_199036 [Emiliania huxleyi CCMP1516]EOD37129.1 hypothetical protein EMIHUDRAFT_225815 [Emiliania huxleyi CCMP1516]|eukprot:XP_005757787.1 hypothetical protein EMIHUDRAFT_199036 [Emiliania huxleyi CCMP1516]